jgi:hypothetical protein
MGSGSGSVWAGASVNVGLDIALHWGVLADGLRSAQEESGTISDIASAPTASSTVGRRSRRSSERTESPTEATLAIN